ncbi:MAG: glutamyl-tRNA reductase [Nitrososphaerales archaeon]
MQRSERVIDAYEMGGLLNLRVTHKKTPIPVLEALNFRDAKRASREIKDIKGVEECLILQTCNRVEIYLFVSHKDPASLEKKIAEYWWRETGFEPELFYPYLDASYSSDTLHHLMRLTSGLGSMVVGEDQILGQIQDSFLRAKDYSTTGPVLRKVFARAVKIGKMVRVKTGVNKGAVSIGTIAINMLKEVAGDLQGKKVLIIGAGEIGALAGKALAARKLAFIFVANRTYDRAVSLAEMLNAKAVRFDRLVETLAKADIVLVATSASHYTLTRNKVAEALKRRAKGRKLLIVDLSQPRNVEKEVAELPDVELHNIDNLRQVADVNLKIRMKEAEKAECLIQKEIDRIISIQKKVDVEPIIQAVSSRADEIRRREVEKAYRLMKTDPTVKRCGHCRMVMENLSKKLMERMMLDPILSLRNAEIDADLDKISVIQEIFKIEPAEWIE